MLRGEETDMASAPAVKYEDMQDRDRHAEEILAAVEFRVDVARERDAVRIGPVGEIDMATIGRLRERVDEAKASGAGRVILDLRATTFVDSSVLHLAVETYDWALANGAEFAIIPGPPAVRRTFSVAALNDQLPFVDVPRA
jgi:anti-anti-sigma factor